MANTATLLVRIVTDTSKAAADLDGAGKKVGKFQGAMSKMALPAAIAGGAILAFGKSAVDAASRTQQAMGAVDSVFGKSAGQIAKWSDQAATSVGLAKSEYAELASVLGAQLKNMGLPMDEVVAKTGDLIKMGADLSATYGGTTAQAVEALSSALKGETDPIEKYGISIKQADIAARQAADGTDKLEGAAGKQAKTMALLALATEQSKDAHGQFAREADSAAGQQQQMSAEIENAKSAIGTGLLPVMAALTGTLASMAKWVGQNSKVVLVLVGIIGTLAATILIINGVYKAYAAAQLLVTLATKLFGETAVKAWLAALGPIGLVIAAVALVVGVFILLYKKSDTFRRLVDTIWAGIKKGAKATAEFFKKAWNLAFRAVSAYVRFYLSVIKFVFNAIRTAANAVASFVKNVWRNTWSAIKTAAGNLSDAVKAVWDAIKDKAGDIADNVKDAWKTTFDALKTAAGNIKDTLAAPFTTMKTAIDKVITAVTDLIQKLTNIKVPKINLPGPLSLGKAAPTVPGLRVAGRGTPTATAAAGGVTINVTGAIDPEATARQIRRILDGHSRRVGLAT